MSKLWKVFSGNCSIYSLPVVVDCGGLIPRLRLGVPAADIACGCDRPSWPVNPVWGGCGNFKPGCCKPGCCKPDNCSPAVVPAGFGKDKPVWPGCKPSCNPLKPVVVVAVADMGNLSPVVPAPIGLNNPPVGATVPSGLVVVGTNKPPPRKTVGKSH